MSLTELKTEISAHKDYKDLTDQQWDVKTTYRGLHKRSQVDFDWLQDLYPKKISALRDRLMGDWDFSCKVSDDGKVLNSPAEILDAVNAKMDEWAYCQQKEQRLLDKLACVIEEPRLRKDESVVRVGTHDAADYYIDYGRPDDTGDGLSTGAAYKTITKYTTVEARVPGDRAFMRANVTWDQDTENVDITFDEDGSVDSYIEIIGCDSVTNDPWSDASDVLPIIDFGDNASLVVNFVSDIFWKWTRIDMTGFADTFSGGLNVSFSDKGHVALESCIIRDGNASVNGDVKLSSGGVIHLTDCTLQDNVDRSIAITNGGYALIDNCTIDAGAGGTLYGVHLTNGGTCDIIDSTIGVANAFSTDSIFCSTGGFARLRNVDWDENFGIADNCYIASEDNDATFGEQLLPLAMGTITRGTASPRAGGGNSFHIVAPNIECGLNNPLLLGDRLAGAFHEWVEAGSYTVTVYARDPDNWATQPGNSGGEGTFYIQASYLSEAGAGDATRTLSSKSAQDSTGDAAWVAYTVSITTAKTGWVYVYVALADYESGKTMEVDNYVTVA